MEGMHVHRAGGVIISSMPETSPHIFLQGLVVESLIGVYPQERHAPQPLSIDVAVGLPSTAAFLSDNFQDTVDYAAVADLIRQEATNGP